MKNKRVLFMEDEDTIREVLTEYMTLVGYEVIQSSDGDSAFEKLMGESFDIAVLDIMVPGPDGLEILDKLRSSGNEMPVIMLTALGDEKTQLTAFNSLADDFISKPVSPIILIKRMEAVLRRAGFVPKSPSEESQREKGIRLVSESYCAYMDGVSLGLTITEYLILEKLMSRPLMTFTRDQLINYAFGEEYITSPRIIDTHVKNLRKKLPGDYIRTVIGIGYQFRGEEI